MKKKVMQKRKRLVYCNPHFNADLFPLDKAISFI